MSDDKPLALRLLTNALPPPPPANDPFPRMARRVPPGVQGTACVRHLTVDRAEAERWAVRALVSGDDYYTRPGRYAILDLDGKIMMSDTDMERRTNRVAFHRARGHVLVLGLGLGMLVAGLKRRGPLTSLMVLERNRDVIDLVWPHVKFGKATVVEADAFHWTPTAGTPLFDTIWADIWPTICPDNLLEMEALFDRYTAWLAPGGWMGFWSLDAVAKRLNAAGLRRFGRLLKGRWE